MMRFQRAPDLCCVSLSRMKAEKSNDTLNTKSSKKYEPFAPSATLPEREEEL